MTDVLDFDAPRDAFEILEGARAALSAPERSEAAVLAALQVSPDDRDVRMGAYKFYFYNNRLAEAVPHALWCVADGARTLGLPTDWRRLAPDSVPCADFDKPRRFLVQSLVAYGWCLSRIGRIDDGLEALAKAIEIDPADTFRVARIVEVIRRGGVEEDDD